MTILAIDPNPQNLDTIERHVTKSRHVFLGATNAAQGLSYFTTENIDVVIVNKVLPDGHGFQVIEVAKSQMPPASIIITSQENSVDAMIEALRLGAIDYIPDPIDIKILRIAINRAYEQRHMHLMAQSESPAPSEAPFPLLQGASAEMQSIFEQIHHCAPYRTTVLITGESGTGKELIAKSIHATSPRADKPFIPINCSAIPKELVESHLFGHEKGAFTSANAQQQGMFEAAHEGTLFLDEIGDLALDAQAKLLRVLEDKQITRVGNTAPIDVDVRLLAATNVNLEQAIIEGKFRQDLYYRLNILHIAMPPLRQRSSDIPLLIEVFLDRFAQENGIPTKHIVPDALEQLQAYHWPGNVRELKNIIERLAVTAQGDTIEYHHLPLHFQDIAPPLEPQAKLDLTPLLGIPLEDVEKMLIAFTLEHTNGNRTRAAGLLGMHLRTLQRKLKEYGEEAVVS